ncbi:HAD-like protein [Thelephora ganbajun]|uniref:HAD-like protein n=1 Tax=Thelephora ganbajun TaxID=370292 RepID=A0ACB6ZEU2_THEGA|nr:HAD-like protein [Thelephora ganbajun]
MQQIKAVVFDIGGVVCRSPLIAIAGYEREHSIPDNYINCSITRRGSSGAWQRFERGEMELWNFYVTFGQELSDTVLGNVWYREYCVQRGIDCPKLPEKLEIDGRDLFGRMMRTSGEFDPIVVSAIQKLRSLGQYRVFALTNNFTGICSSDATRTTGPAGQPPPGFSLEEEMKFLGWEQGITPPSLRNLFDDFCDSSVLGMRKPEPEFYLTACLRNGVKPEECVFLDDLGMNLKAAKALGMQTIRVPIGGSVEAIKSLESILGIDLESIGAGVGTLISTPKL